MNYFEYIKKAKNEFKTLVIEFPELANLSTREMDVFAQLLTDQTLQEIATELYISYSSVHFHCKNIYRKLGISNRKQLLIKYKDLQ